MALKLDPEVFKRSAQRACRLHVLSPEDRAQFCMEMAKTYARMGNEAEMLHSLAMAARRVEIDAGDEQGQGAGQVCNDPRVVMIVQAASRAGDPAGGRNVATGAVPALPPAAPPTTALHLIQRRDES